MGLPIVFPTGPELAALVVAALGHGDNQSADSFSFVRG